MADKQRARAEQLLREHARHWLGALRPVVHRARFARGFLARLELNGRWAASEEAWAAHARDPQLATVEDLIPGRAVGPLYARFVTSPAMTALRRVEVFDRPTLAALRETSARLVHVSCPRWKVGKYVRELAVHVLPACERFEALRSFAVHHEGVESLLKSRVYEQLTSLTVAGGLAAGLALWPKLSRGVALTLARSAMLDDCVTTRVAWTGALTVRRDGSRVVARAAGDWVISELIEHFAALPAEVSVLEVEGAGDAAAALQDATQRRRIDLVLRPLARRIGNVSGLDKP